MKTLAGDGVGAADEPGSLRRRAALAEWYSVPPETFDGLSDTAMDSILDAIRDTPSRWAGIPRSERGR